jgi:hypothetical protein
MVVWMKILTFFISSYFLITACTRTSGSNCLAAGMTTVESSKTSAFVQGGYIQFGDKMCTATFEIIDVGQNEISLRAYSARHCRFESSSNKINTSVSLYFDQTIGKSAGYIKNIPVQEDFSMRAASAMSAVAQLNSPAAKDLVTEALQIPIHYDPWGDDIFSGKDSIICNNKEIAPDLNDPAKTLNQSCWNALDLGAYDLRIQRTSVSAGDYLFLSERLKSKQSELKSSLDKNPALAAEHQKIRTQLASSLGLLRFKKVSRLAYLLNLDLCKVRSSADVNTNQLCSIQKKMIDLVGQNFVEIDDSGEKINIFDRLAKVGTTDNSGVPGLSFSRLRAGERMQLQQDSIDFASALDLATGLAAEINSIYKNKTTLLAISIRNAIKSQSGNVSETKMSPALVLGTNLNSIDSSGLKKMRYVQLPLTAVSSNPSHFVLTGQIDHLLLGHIFGVNGYGILRFGLPRSSDVVRFQPTDSGSLISLSGLIPLFVLNTVNDQPTSGGASILALPEASSEQIPSIPAKAGSKAEKSFDQIGAKPVTLSPETSCR